MICLSKNCPSAKLSDGRLVLSLPDAETPAVWIMSLADTVTAVLRLETDRQGFFVIKKHGGHGAKAGAAETIAVYRDRDAALRAMNCATRAMGNARDGRQNSRFKFWFTRFVYAWFIISLLMIFRVDAMILRAVMSPPAGYMPIPSAEALQTPQAQQQPQAPQNMDATGVPLSAEDFLKHQSTKIVIP